MWSFLACYLSFFALAPEPAPLFVATTPPVAMILRELTAGRTELHTLLPSGASPHTFDPKPSDLALVARARALVFVGPELESWATKLAAKEAIALLAFLPPSQRLPAGGEEHEHGHEHGLYDPHFWTDPSAVRALLPGLAAKLCAVDGAGCATYQKNAATFAQSLLRLDTEASQRLAALKGRAVLASHPFFQYFFAHYGTLSPKVVAPSCEHEPTPRALGAIFSYVAANSIKVVFSARQDSQRPAQLVAEQTGARVVVLDGLGAPDLSYAAWFSSQAAKVAEALR